MTDHIPSIILLVVFAIVWLLIIIRFAKDRLAPVKTVKAVVADKNTVESLSKYNANGKHIRYVIVFEAAGKKLSFYVSEFSYGGYRKGERGMLTYQGSRLIDFS